MKGAILEIVAWLVVVVIAIGSVFCIAASCGCTPSALNAQAVAADAVGRSVNVSIPTLVELYDLEGRAAIAVASSRDEAEYRLDLVREKWRPVWDALDVAAQAHDAWVAAIEAGTATPQLAAEVAEAYCRLRSAAWEMAELPDNPIIPCGEVMP